MCKSNNLCQIQFNTMTGGKKYSHTVIYNKTQIAEDEVYNTIIRRTWYNDKRIVEVDPGQLEYLLDKEEENEMEKKIIELTQSEEGMHCLMCGSEEGHIKVKIQRINPVDCVTSFHVCNKCLVQMQNDIQKVCE